MSIKTNETAKHTSLIFSARPNYFLKTSMQEQRNSSVLKIKSSKCQSHATLISQNLKKQTSHFHYNFIAKKNDSLHYLLGMHFCSLWVSFQAGLFITGRSVLDQTFDKWLIRRAASAEQLKVNFHTSACGDEFKACALRVAALVTLSGWPLPCAFAKITSSLTGRFSFSSCTSMQRTSEHHRRVKPWKWGRQGAVVTECESEWQTASSRTRPRCVSVSKNWATCLLWVLGLICTATLV